MTAPAITERTGTAADPCPGTNENRRPVAAVGGRFAEASAATRLTRAVWARCWTRWGVSRQTTTPITASRTAIEQRAPRPRTVQSALIPGAASTRRTSPIGMAGDAATARTTASTTPTTTVIAGPIAVTAAI